jgi:pimeloyl-ACP methyl ester carboxylesterase
MGSTWRTGEVRTRGFRQFYREWQPVSGRALPVLALHGSLTQSGMWIALTEKLGTVRMLCPDQRGYGRSEDPAGDSCADFALDAAAVAESLLPGRFVLMGHSFACAIALEAARLLLQRVAAVVLVDPVVRVGSVPPAAAAGLPIIPDGFESLDDAERHFLATEEGDWPQPALRRFVADVMLSRDGTYIFPYSQERLRRLRAFTASPAGDFDVLAKARMVACPVLVFRGGLSKRFTAAAEPLLLNAFAGPVRLVLCPRSGHFPTATEPEIVATAINEFTRGVG